MLKDIVSGQGERITETRYNMRLFAICLLMPLIITIVHVYAHSGLLDSIGLTESNADTVRVRLGLLVNERDNMSYAAWAQQARLGHILARDLYTTAPHTAAFFNPYFFGIGTLAGVVGLPPYTVMILASIPASGLFGYVVYKLARSSGLREAASIGAVGLAMFGSGPSWVLYILQAALGKFGHGPRPLLGIDGYFFDIFPVTIFLAYPFASFSLLMVALAAFFISRALTEPDQLNSNRCFQAAACGACTVLVRPYDGFLLCALLSACLCGMLAWRRLRGEVANGLVASGGLAVGLLVVPACLYVMAVSHLPVWREFARASFGVRPAFHEMVIGFSVLWLFAGVGASRAMAERNHRLTFLIGWASLVTIATLLVGGFTARFSSGVVIPYSVLAAYGADWLFIRRGYRVKLVFLLSAALLVSTVITSAFDYASVLSQPRPTIDVEVRDAAYAIRTRAGRELPVVLTGCSIGVFIPGIAGLQVYAGHWSLTPAYASKCVRLAEAGLSEDPDAQHFHADVLSTLMREVAPDYVLVRKGSPAETWLVNTRGAILIREGVRWSTLSAAK